MLQLLPQWRFVNTDCKNRAYYISVFTSSTFKNPAVHYVTFSYIRLIRDLLSPIAKLKKTEMVPERGELQRLYALGWRESQRTEWKNKIQEFSNLFMSQPSNCLISSGSTTTSLTQNTLLKNHFGQELRSDTENHICFLGVAVPKCYLQEYPKRSDE